MASDTVNHYDKFHGYLVELLQSYTKLGELLHKKLTAIANFDIKTLDDIMKEEQVFVLLSRGFDANIQSYREKLSLKGDSLSEVIDEMPEEYHTRFRQVAVQFKDKLQEIKALNENCQSLIEERIYTLERSIHRIDKSSGPSYGKTAEKPSPSIDSHMLKKSV